MGEEKSHWVQVVEAMMDHKAKDKVVKGEDLKTRNPRTKQGAVRLEMKFVLHGIGKDTRQTAAYQTFKEYIIQLVQKSFRNGKDVADSLRKMEKKNMLKNMDAKKADITRDRRQQQSY
jgi:hypothetical protein